jgi:hypothetical protein
VRKVTAAIQPFVFHNVFLHFTQTSRSNIVPQFLHSTLQVHITREPETRRLALASDHGKPIV